jgi:hypothetical protein
MFSYNRSHWSKPSTQPARLPRASQAEDTRTVQEPPAPARSIMTLSNTFKSLVEAGFIFRSLFKWTG